MVKINTYLRVGEVIVENIRYIFEISIPVYLMFCLLYKIYRGKRKLSLRDYIFEFVFVVYILSVLVLFQILPINISDFKAVSITPSMLPFLTILGGDGGGARNLGEALRRIGEGASMIRTKGEAGTGDIVQAVTHMRTMMDDIRRVKNSPKEELMTLAKEFNAPYDLIEYVWENGKLPVVNFAAGGIATPADAALMMQLGSEGVFVGSGIFKSGDPEKRARAIVLATTYYNDPIKLAEVSEDLGKAISGINYSEITTKYEERGW